MNYLIIVLISYLLGSVNAAILIVKLMSKEDIRTKGSGNAGMTNVLRNKGKRAAAGTLLFDMFKGGIAVVIASLLSPLLNLDPNIATAVAGLSAVIGHCFPVFFKFKGGKGVATTFGVLIFLNFYICLVAFLVFLLLTVTTKILSLGSVVGLFLVIPLSFFENIFGGEYNLVRALMFSGMIILMLIKHHGNITRILKGEERKVSLKRK